MKDPPSRTKVVVRHLPPTLSNSDFFSQIDTRFQGRYSWSSFRPGKISYKHQRNARAYIKFNTADDVLEFAEFFNGHVFVNEKGAQYKAIVEYAPSQRIPRPCNKKDGREGNIYKDPDYLDFLKLIAKAAEHLPSAEIQLERKEAEQAGAGKESPIITPLMEFVRKKRAAGNGPQGKSAVVKVSRRGQATLNKSSSMPKKRNSEKKKYIMKESAKVSNRKEKSAFIVVARREDQSATSTGKEISEIENVPGIEGSVSGIPLTIDSGKKKILLLKGKERGTPQAAEGVPQQQGATNTAGNSSAITVPKQKQRREAGGRLIRNILLSNDARQSASAVQQKTPENGKRPPRSNSRPGLSDNVYNNKSYAGSSDGHSKPSQDEFMKKDSHNLVSFNEKAEKRTRNKDRADRGVWAPLRRSDAVHPNEDSLSSMLQSPAEGSSKQYGRRVASHSIKDDASSNSSDSRSSRRGGVTGHVYSEKQVWVQKPSSGS